MTGTVPGFEKGPFRYDGNRYDGKPHDVHP
jgi:hypothetical protein